MRYLYNRRIYVDSKLGTWRRIYAHFGDRVLHCHIRPSIDSQVGRSRKIYSKQADLYGPADNSLLYRRNCASLLVLV